MAATFDCGSSGFVTWAFGRSFVRYTAAFVLVVVVLKRVRSTAWLELGVDPVSAIAGLPVNWCDWAVPGILSSFCTMSGLLAAIYVFYVRAIETEDASRREELRRIDLERQMSEARLKVMEAQIEPHFIFNALANVQRLFETDPTAGNAMLRQLSRYLSAALPRMREAESTLASLEAAPGSPSAAKLSSLLSHKRAHARCGNDRWLPRSAEHR